MVQYIRVYVEANNTNNMSLSDFKRSYSLSYPNLLAVSSKDWFDRKRFDIEKVLRRGFLLSHRLKS